MSIESTGTKAIPRRPFGRYADEISIIGLGGYHLGTVGTVTESVRIVHEAIDTGINLFDNAGSTTKARASGAWGARSQAVATPSS